MVTADHADTGSPKAIVAKRRMRAIDPLTQVRVLPGLTVAGDHTELRDVDVIVGCVDHDRPRHRLNSGLVHRIGSIELATPGFRIGSYLPDWLLGRRAAGPRRS